MSNDKNLPPPRFTVTENEEIPDSLREKLQAETGIADMSDYHIQMRMMATAVFMFVANHEIPLEQRADVQNAWNHFLNKESECRALERYAERIAKLSEPTRSLPEEIRLAIVQSRMNEFASTAWSQLHNLITVLNPNQGDTAK